MSTVPKEHPPIARSDSATQLKLVMPPASPVTSQTSVNRECVKTNEAIACSPGTIDAIQRELENSFAKAATSTPNPGSIAAAFKQSAIARISHSLGNSANSVAVSQQQQQHQQQVFVHPLPKPSPSNSAKSNSAPARVR